MYTHLWLYTLYLHRIVEWFESEGTLKTLAAISVLWAGCHSLDQAAQAPTFSGQYQVQINFFTFSSKSVVHIMKFDN